MAPPSASACLVPLLGAVSASNAGALLHSALETCKAAGAFEDADLKSLIYVLLLFFFV